MSTSNRIPRHIEEALRTNRRDFLKGAGLLAVSFGVFGGAAIAGAEAQTAAPPGAGPYRDPDFRQIDSWIVIHEDNTATFFVGKTDPGQGTGTGFRQLMSDELDIAFDRTTCIMGSTDITVDQVGSGGSTAMERDSWPMRRVAAEARRVLLDMASVRLGVPAAHLSVSNAVITAQADRSKHVTYGELIAGKKFNVTLTGNNVYSVTGQARTKSVPELKYTGQPLQRDDIPAKVDGSLKWAVDVKLPPFRPSAVVVRALTVVETVLLPLLVPSLVKTASVVPAPPVPNTAVPLKLVVEPIVPISVRIDWNSVFRAVACAVDKPPVEA